MHLVYDYYGLEIRFGSDACLPLRVFGSRGGRSSCIQLQFENGMLTRQELLSTENPLDEDDLKTFLQLVENNCSELIKAWLDLFLYQKPVEPEIIKQKIRN